MKKLIIALLGLTALVPVAATAAPIAIEWASMRRLAPPAPGNGLSENSSISSDGRFVAFSSRASNLVADDSNNAEDVFVYDSTSNTVERVSVNNAGEQGTFNGGGGGNADSRNPAISADGRYVAFQSKANNLVPGDDNDQNDSSRGEDIFVYDRITKTVTRVSLSDGGGQSNQASETPSISGDGRYVAFASSANNLVSGFANGQVSVYISDRTTGRAIVGIPLPPDPAEANRNCLNPAISSDGVFVAFEFAVDRSVSSTPGYQYRDIYFYNRATPAIGRITGTADGLAADRTDSRSPSLSADGRYIAFHSNVQITNDNSSSVDVFVHDRSTGFNRLVSVDETGNTQGAGDSMNPSISGDGRFVAFESWAANLVNSDTNGTMDIFRKDLLTGEVSLLSMTPAGIQGDGASAFASVSSDGSRVVFQSDASNLATGDSNDSSDIFVAETEPVNVTPPTLTIDRATPGSATVSWTPATPGFVLQENASLSPVSWTNSPSGAANPTPVPATALTKFYRLILDRP